MVTPNTRRNMRRRQRLRGRIKRGLAVVSTVIMAFGISIFAIDGASATHPVVTGSAECAPGTLTWTVQGDTSYPRETATVVWQSRPTTPTLVGQSVKGSQTVSATEAITMAGDYALTVKVQWTNHAKGDLVSQQGTVKVTACTVPFDWGWKYPPTCDGITIPFPANLPESQLGLIEVNVTGSSAGGAWSMNYKLEGDAYWAKYPNGHAGVTLFIPWDDPLWRNGTVPQGAWTVTWIQVHGTDYHWQGELKCGSEPTPTPTPTPTTTPSPTPEPSQSPTPEPSETPTPTPEPSTSPTPTPEPSETPTPTPEPSTSPTPTPEPSESPTPTPTPTIEPTPEPTVTPTPTPEPSDSPTTEPTPEPSETPTPEPTPTPTIEPTPEPTVTPTPTPSASPTTEPTPEPSDSPSQTPSPKPSDSTTPSPTSSPTPPSGNLSDTGADGEQMRGLAGAALVLMAAGGTIMLIVRRQQRSQQSN